MQTGQAAGGVSAPGATIALIVAPYYENITDKLVAGAIAAIEAAGATHTLCEVPGAFEIPPAISFLARAQPDAHEGYVALGCVVRGETSHYDYVCGESARALMDLGLRDGLAIGYGILTVENLAQADVRSTPERNKGAEAAHACLALVALKRALKDGAR